MHAIVGKIVNVSADESVIGDKNKILPEKVNALVFDQYRSGYFAIETGDHYLYICNAEDVYGNEQEEAVYAWDGYSQIRPAK